MTDDNESKVVAFFKCAKPIMKTIEGEYHDETYHDGDEVSFQRCYMKKFDRKNLEGCFKQLENHHLLHRATCSYIGRENLE